MPSPAARPPSPTPLSSPPDRGTHLSCPHCGKNLRAMRQQLSKPSAQPWWHSAPLGPTVLACDPDQLPPGIYYDVDPWAWEDDA